jgi:MATE family multidrug resistance protein
MGPIPALGVAGAAYGTLIGNVVSTVILFAKFFGKSCHRRFRTRYAFAFSWPLTRELLKKGIPSGVEMFLNMSAFQLLILMFHALGPESATASSVMFNWDMVAYVPLMGLEVASTSLVGRYVGAKDGAAASRSTYSGLKLGWGYSLLMGIFFIFLPGILTDIFKPDVAEASAEAIAIFESARPMSIFMLRIATFYIFVEVLLVIYAGALRGAGDTLWVMFACAIMNWCVAGSLYLVAYVFGLPAHLAWIAVVAVYSTAPVLFWLRWKNGKWRRHILDV